MRYSINELGDTRIYHSLKFITVYIRYTIILFYNICTRIYCMRVQNHYETRALKNLNCANCILYIVCVHTSRHNMIMFI
jgi:hypothetical protein